MAEGGGVWLRNDDNDPEFWNVLPTVLGAGAVGFVGILMAVLERVELKGDKRRVGDDLE